MSHLHDSDNVIKVYNSAMDEIDSVYPKLCSSDPSIEQPDGWVSDLILENLNIPKVKIKESKVRDDSSAYRLSFRDLMKLLYLKQKKVASENLMDASNGAVLNKNVEVQKFIYGVHDDQLSELNLELQVNTKRYNVLNERNNSIRDFLRSTDSLNVSEDDFYDLKNSVGSINAEIEKLINEKNEASYISKEFKRELSELDIFLKKTKEKYQENNVKINSLIRLKYTYEHDLQCIDASKKFKKHKVEFTHEGAFECPLCESKLSIDSPVLTEEEVENEIRSLRNRIVGCKTSLERLYNLQDSLNADMRELEVTISSIRGKFDRDNVLIISPLVETINTMHNSKKLVYTKLASAEKNIKLQKKLDESVKEAANLKKTIFFIKESIKGMEEELKNIDDIIYGIAGEFRYLMSHSKLSNNYGSTIDKKFMPVFRDRTYAKISSGGVRTIMSVNLYLSRLRYLIKNGGNLPTFLMLDTPGQNIGRYARVKSVEDNVSDPAVYEEIYKQIVDVKKLSDKHEIKYQIIVVDNDLANCLNNEDYHLVKRFDKSGAEYEKGLIFDA
ncbi:hypothetical protein [Halovibrio sp. HP20-50]|uniref:hypothetical protein n=1 Tax=Halovibrio sp. HP20-59 TaxID=3080275 RepID=UPI00294B4044|nr:hypothetical protein [Halovibrio sp. HP20-59]MEA2119947.1 hypothetical protein [Halovibrio sp. HP20-59]